MNTTETSGSWQTQTPVDVASLKLQLRALQSKYDDLINTHARLIVGMYKYDQTLVGEEYRYAMFDKSNLSRTEIDEKLVKLTTPAPFRVDTTQPQ